MATIAENLSRIQSAKTDIKTAIEAKGVTVPSSATIDTYATYVSQISGGGAATPSSLSDWTYDSYGKITSAVIRSGVTSIGEAAFYRCCFLSAVTIPDSVTSIGPLAFYQSFSQSDSNITIPNSVTSIDYGAFRECDRLISVTIGSGVTSIGVYAFYNCTTLKSITINATTPPSGGSTGYGIFDDTPISQGMGHIYVPEESVDLYKASSGFSAYSAVITCIGCSTCSEKLCGIDGNGDEFTIDDDGNATLRQDDNISMLNPVEATVGNIILGILERAFQNCYLLTSVTIPDSVIYIGKGAFDSCFDLRSIDIPSGVTDIGDNAFDYCTGLTSITVNATTPPTLGISAFDNTNDCPIYVPAESVETYKAESEWSNYESRIRAIDNE